MEFKCLFKTIERSFILVRTFQECVLEWHKLCSEKGIPVSDRFSLSGTLGEPVRIREWQIAGLPVDKYAKKNTLTEALIPESNKSLNKLLL